MYQQGDCGLGKLDIDVAEVKKLVELVEKHGLEELTVEEGDLSITIKGRSSQAVVPIVVQAGAQLPHVESAEMAHPAVEAPEPGYSEVEAAEEGLYDIIAPVVGVFYRAPAPDAPVFCEVGDVIEVGTEVGLIEAMKVFSPIPSEVAGEVVEIPAENGKLVQQGEVLVRIRLSEG